jgi:hypothetical protein
MCHASSVEFLTFWQPTATVRHPDLLACFGAVVPVHVLFAKQKT